MIEINNLKKVYGEKTVIDIPSLTLNQSELVSLVGNNGAGKTTLMRLILDLIRANEGTVTSNGMLVNESDQWKYYTGSFIDGRFLIDFLTPEEYFELIANIYNIDHNTLQQRLQTYESLMNGEVLGTKKYLRDFSEGNRQKIGIIGALLIEPQVLILDEPFNYLDPSSQILIAKQIEHYCRTTGALVILSSHNLNFVSDISTRILLLEKGVIKFDLNNDKGSAMTTLSTYFEQADSTATNTEEQ